MKIIVLTPYPKNEIGNGDGRYSYELIKEIKRINTPHTIEVVQPQKKLHFFKIIIFDLFVLPIILRKKHADLYHATTPGEAIIPILFRKKTLLTLHDIMHITYPQGTRLLKRIYFLFCCFFIKKVNYIIASSDFTKREIIKKLNISEKKIKRIYLGIDNKFKKLESKNYKNRIGYLGGSGGRKNVASLIKAFSILTTNNSYGDYKLILSIRPTQKLKNLINKLGINNIEFIGNIDEKNIVSFYNSLDVFVFPSLYEGFGFPPLEAMRCGCPVICSNNTSVSEIVGDAAIKVNANNPNEIADSIRSLLGDKKLRNLMSEKGIKKSKDYKWEYTSREIINTYDQIMQ